MMIMMILTMMMVTMMMMTMMMTMIMMMIDDDDDDKYFPHRTISRSNSRSPGSQRALAAQVVNCPNYPSSSCSCLECYENHLEQQVLSL